MNPRFSIARAAVAVSGLVAVLTVIPASAQTKLLFNSFIPSGHPINTQVMQPWAKDVAQASKGSLAIEFTATSLAPPPGQLDLVTKGGADIAYQYGGVVPLRLHLIQATEVPSAGGSALQTSVALWRTHAKYFESAGDTKGVKVLGVFTFPRQYLQSLKEPIASIDQLKRMKIATTPGLASRIYGQFTTGVVTSPAVRFFEFVSKGTVDGYTSVSAIDIQSFNLARDTKYMYAIPGGMPSPAFLFAMNEGKWKSLAPAEQEAITSLGGEAFARRFGAIDAVNDAVLKQFAAQGMQIGTLSDAFGAEFRKAIQVVEADWIAEAAKRGVDGRAALDFYRTQINEVK